MYSIEAAFERRWVTRAAAAALLVLIASCTPSSATPDDPRLARIYGDVAILYSTYVAELEQKGRKSVQRGRATEVFVWRNGVWQNAGWHLDAGC